MAAFLCLVLLHTHVPEIVLLPGSSSSYGRSDLQSHLIPSLVTDPGSADVPPWLSTLAPLIDSSDGYDRHRGL